MAAVCRKTWGVTFLCAWEGARRRRSGNVNGHALSDGIEAERSTPVGWEQRILAVADSFGHPVA